jgi:hypothetical protein
MIPQPLLFRLRRKRIGGYSGSRLKFKTVRRINKKWTEKTPVRSVLKEKGMSGAS